MANPTETIPLHGSRRLVFRVAKRDLFPPYVSGKALLKPAGVMRETRISKEEIKACRQDIDFVDLGFSVYLVAFQKAIFFFLFGVLFSFLLFLFFSRFVLCWVGGVFV